jgi:hypothetical protein
MHSPLSWDEWYAPFIWRARFLPLAHFVSGDLLMMDSAVLTTLRTGGIWRPTHSTFYVGRLSHPKISKFGMLLKFTKFKTFFSID